jgi:hypothetical protein
MDEDDAEEIKEGLMDVECELGRIMSDLGSAKFFALRAEKRLQAMKEDLGKLRELLAQALVEPALPSLEEAQEQIRELGVDPEELSRSVIERLEKKHGPSITWALPYQPAPPPKGPK